MSALIAIGTAGLYHTASTPPVLMEDGHRSPASSTSTVPSSSPSYFPDSPSYHSPTGRGISGGAGLPIPVHPLLSSYPSSSSLPPSVLSSILSANAVISPLQRGSLSSLHASYYNANPSIEDSFAVEPLLVDGGVLMGMFDGHSGAAASLFCKRHLLHYLQTYHSRGWTKEPLDPLPFVEADAHFLSQAWKDGRVVDGLAGSCYNVVHIRQRRVTSANAGDCRAIIGRRVDPSTSPSLLPSAVRMGHQRSPTHWAVELSQDHQIDVNPSERLRLLREHPGEEDVLRRNRVKGRLQPTRGLGDGAYKTLGYYRERVRLSGGRGESAVYRPPYTTAEPEVWAHDLTDADDFLVLSTDGLFEDLSSQEVVEYVSEWMEAHRSDSQPSTRLSGSRWLPSWLSGSSSHGTPPSSSSTATATASSLSAYDNVSSFLISRALLHASEKQVGRLKSEADSLSWALRVALPQRRHVHDDLSVLVVFFEHTGKWEKDGPVAYEVPLPEPLQRAIREGEKVPGQAATGTTEPSVPPIYSKL